MRDGNNVNDNVPKRFKSNNNVNDNDRNSSKYDRSKQVELLGARIADRLGAKRDSLPFIYKVVWTQPEFRIWGNVEQAVKGKNPMGLFIFLSKRDGV